MKMPNKDRTFINLEISEELKTELQKEAEEKEMTLSGLVRLIIKEHLKNK